VVITEIYEELKNQANRFDGIEGQILGLINTNIKNVELVKTAKTIHGLSTYFFNQHHIFNILLEAINDVKLVNSYQLLEIECQLRDDEQKV